MPGRTASSSFLERLRLIEPSVSVEWSDKHERWFVTQRGDDGKTRYIEVVQNEDGSYRDLDDRVVDSVATMFFKNRAIPDTVEYVERQFDRNRDEREKELSDRIEATNDYYVPILKGKRAVGVDGFGKNFKYSKERSVDVG